MKFIFLDLIVLKIFKERQATMQCNGEQYNAMEFVEAQPFCCDSMSPRTDQEAIFNQFLENRGTINRVLEIITYEKNNGRNWISTKYFNLQNGIRTEIHPHMITGSFVVWQSKIIVLKADCEFHNRSFVMNSLQKRSLDL